MMERLSIEGTERQLRFPTLVLSQTHFLKLQLTLAILFLQQTLLGVCEAPKRLAHWIPQYYFISIMPSNFFLLPKYQDLCRKSSAELQINQSSAMGKKAALSQSKSQTSNPPQQLLISPKKVADYSISEKNYLQFFQFLKELHGAERQEGPCDSGLQSSLTLITDSLMNFFNFEKVYSSRQLECSTICLANLLNVIGNKVTSLTFSKEFVLKLRRVAVDLAEQPHQIGFQQKIQAILYILVVFIYKERIGEVRSIREANKLIYRDGILVRSLLELVLPQDRKIAKFYGIVILNLSNKKNNNATKKLIIKSILVNFGRIEHEATLLNLLVYLRSQKNKVSLNLKDVIEGRIFHLLIQAYPRHIHEYQSFYILDYLQHLLLLFPSLASHVTSSKFIPFLLQSAAPTNLHHPLHEETIISFTHRTLQYLQTSEKRSLIEQIAKIEPPNHYITVKVVHMLIQFQMEWTQLVGLVMKGYFERLLAVIRSEEEQQIRRRANELYIKVVSKVAVGNISISKYLLYKLKKQLQLQNNQPFLAMLSEANLYANGQMIHQLI